MARPRAIGLNHVAIEVGDVDEALAFYDRFFEVRLRGRVPGMAFIDLGDQFVAVAEGPPADPAAERHFGLVVDDREAVRELVRDAGLEAGRPGGDLRIEDASGNIIEVVDYAEVQFTKAPAVLRGMGVEAPAKTEAALAELREKGMA